MARAVFAGQLSHPETAQPRNFLGAVNENSHTASFTNRRMVAEPATWRVTRDRDTRPPVSTSPAF